MSFQHELLEFKELETQTINGKRHYHVDGEYYPSVTTVLSGESKPALDAWRKRIGDEKADQIMRAAASRGEGMHFLLEQYVNNEDMTSHLKAAMPSHTHLYLQIKRELDESLGKVFAVEAPLYSKNLGIAGRVDLIAEWNGKPAIIDFKSATKQKKRDWIKGYFMQEALYSYMIHEMHDFFVPNIVTIVAHENENSAAVFEERGANWLKPAVQLVADFYEKAANNPTEMIK